MRADEHRCYRELLGAYVFGQLEHAELREVVALLSTAWALPPSDLKDRGLAAVLCEPRAEGYRGRACGRRRPVRRRCKP